MAVIDIEEPSEGMQAPESRSTIYDVSAAIAGGVIAVGGTVVYFVSGSKFSSIESACNVTPQQDCSTTRYNNSVSEIQTLDRIAHISWIAGGALVAGSALHYWLGGREKSVSVAFNPLDRGFALEATF